MSDAEAIMRWGNILLWGWVAAYMAGGAFCAIFGPTRRGDPMRLACFVTAFVFVGFNLKWLLAPESDAARLLLLVVGAADAVLIWRLGSAYGRGKPL